MKGWIKWSKSCRKWWRNQQVIGEIWRRRWIENERKSWEKRWENGKLQKKIKLSSKIKQFKKNFGG